MTRIPLNKILQKQPHEPNISDPIKYAFIAIILFIIVFFIWASFSRINAAAIAQGKIVVASKRQTVQHLEGGIIKKIYVKDGSFVKAGAPLIKLSNIKAKGALDEIQGQLFEYVAQKARLHAERLALKSIIFPKRLSSLESTEKVNKIIAAQRHIFETNRKAHQGQLQIIQFKISQLKHKIASFKAQTQSVTKQIALIEEELKALVYLEKRKLIEKPKVLAIKREHARLLGNKGEYQGRIARSKQQIAEMHSQIITTKQERQKEILTLLRDTQQKLIQLLEREKAATDVLTRTLIIAPMSGIVLGLQKHTLTGVISPGQEILDIVPNNMQYVIQANINPLDVDVVHPGLIVKIQLTAYKQRHAPTLIGKVSLVSADIMENSNTGEQFYQVEIDKFQNQLVKLKNVTLYSGMPVQVMIITDNRTPLSYLLAPFIDSFHRSFREN